jgi:2-C-methyl-D-erythritol 2,4-cyclodiphosphate synthase
MRIGHGYDVHRLINDPARRLVLGGVEIPSELALEGHSDADVLTHAVMDALLGALALGDIGKHFPDTDDRYLGISSMLLLEKVMELVRAAGASVSNIDATVIAQRPRLAEHIDAVRASLAAALGVDVSRVSVKATTEEKLGFTGRGEGIAAHAVALLNE